jgi:hypothetical protein
MSDPTPNLDDRDRDRSAPPPGTARGSEPEAEAKRQGVAVGILGGIGCLGATLSLVVIVAVCVLAFVMIRGCVGDGGSIPPQPLDPVEVRRGASEAAPATP